MDRAPKVFISYSWKSEEYKEEVLHLAERLRGDGVDVILDRWHLRHGYDMYAFMEGGIREADKVLILCERSYVEKANKRESGTGTETRIISPSLYPESRQEKFIPVFMESHRIVPDFLRGRIGIPFQQQSDTQYKEMLRVIFNIPEVEIPQLGQPPAWLNKWNTPRQTVPAPSAEKQPEPEVELPPSADVKEEAALPSPREEEPIFPDDEAFERFLHSDNTRQTETVSEPLSDPMPAPIKNYDFEPTPEGIVITKYKGKRGKVKIPGEINGQPVIKIAKEAFDYCETLNSVTIPDTVTAIGTRAFYHCTELTDVKLPASLTRIGNSAFCECTALTSIIIPDKVENIGQFAFDKCTVLEAVTIPASIRQIYSCAFSRTSLKTVYYNGSKSQWTSIVFEKGNEALTQAKRQHGIIECSPVVDFDYKIHPNGVTITKYKGKGGKVVIPAHINGLPVITIGKEAFENCKELTSVTLPDSVKYIEDWAFSGCTSLPCVTIPASVTSIGYAAFYGCSGLSSVLISDSVKEVGDSAFYGCSGLTSVSISNSITSIGDAVFYRCSNLTTISIPNSVTSIGDSAFYCCSSLTSVSIPNSVTKIKNGAFYGCSGLTSVSISESVTSIGNSTFEGCFRLPSILIPDNVTNIEGWAFAGCSRLTSIIIPDNVTSIGGGAFEGCSSLTSIFISVNLTSIGDRAFFNCNGIRDVYYNGSNRQWDAIDINNFLSGNAPLKKATFHFNSINQPREV